VFSATHVGGNAKADQTREIAKMNDLLSALGNA
jgi:hypothetical protein